MKIRSTNLRNVITLICLTLSLLFSKATAQITVRHATPPYSKLIKDGGGYAWQGGEVGPVTTNPIKLNDVDIGRLDLEHRLFTDRAPNPDRGGIAVDGGFTGTGKNPFPKIGQHKGTKYNFVQTVRTNVPLSPLLPANADYVDSKNPRTNPFYPTNPAGKNKNPAGNPFSAVFYDSPNRDANNVKTTWDAELMLTCTYEQRIDVIGSLDWGFDIAADKTPNDGTVTVARHAPDKFGAPSAGAIDALKRQSKGSRNEKGWAIGDSGCKAKAKPKDAVSLGEGTSSIRIESLHSDEPVDQVLIFPRNHNISDFGAGTASSGNWGSSLWPDGKVAPDGLSFFQDGILFSGDSIIGSEVSMNFDLGGSTGYAHESFFDIYLHTADGTWEPYVLETQELLGDLNGNGVLDDGDLAEWDVMQTAPTDWETETGFDSLFRGDLDHDGMLGPSDRSLLSGVLSGERGCVDCVPVPEPSSLSFLVVTAVMILGKVRRRK